MPNTELNKRILLLIQSSGLSDYDQRSALGMARTWIEKREPFVPTQVREFQARDGLASELIAILGEAAVENDEMVNALAEARMEINAPYKRQEFVGTAPAKEWKKLRVEASRNGQQ